jgi:hypothetical protein
MIINIDSNNDHANADELIRAKRNDDSNAMDASDLQANKPSKPKGSIRRKINYESDSNETDQSDQQKEKQWHSTVSFC